MTYTINDKRGSNHNIQASDSIWNHRDSLNDGMRLRITVPVEQASTRQAITRYDWQKTLSLSRQLFARVNEVSGALQQKNLYAIGDSWEPRFDGADQAWGNLAEEWLFNWFQVCNVRGEPFDFLTSLYVDSLAIDRDGDAAMITVVKDGEPKLQFISAHQIGVRNGGNCVDSTGYGTVQGGTYDGLRIYNGVIFGNKGNVVAYNIMGTVASEDMQVPLASCQLLYEPEWSDQGRGIPKLAASQLHWMDYEDIHTFLKKQVKQDSAQGILHYNESGEAPTEADFITGKSSGDVNQDVKIEHLEGNEIMYFKAQGGGKIEPFKSERPSPNVDAFTMRLVRGCLQSMGWFFEIYDPSRLGGSSTRLIQDMARSSIRSKQRTIHKRALRAVSHGLAWAMENGDIPRNDNKDWLKWSFTLPAKLTVDARYDDQTAMDRIKMSAGTYSDLFGEKGRWWEDEVNQRIKEQVYIQNACAVAGVALERVQMLTPNGTPNAAQTASADTQVTTENL